jgi:hypothetical protein
VTPPDAIDAAAASAARAAMDAYSRGVNMGIRATVDALTHGQPWTVERLDEWIALMRDHIAIHSEHTL